MKKLKFLFFPTILALTFGLMLSCAKKDDSSSSETDTSSSSTVTVSGKVQKGPYVQGTEITVRELDSSMTPTGNTFTGSIDDNTGSFSIKGTLTNKIVELAADGFYFNEVSGSLSSAKLALQAFSDLTDSSSVNVNLMTHLEKKRVEYLMDNSKMNFAAAKTQAQTEILKIFNIDNVTLGNSETLDISKSGDGNAVLLAISAILQSDKTEAELTELLSTINTDIRTDGTLDSTTTKATLVTAMEYLKSRRSTIRSNIESRYSSLGISATIPAFESYAFNLDSTAPTVSSTSPSDGATTVVSIIYATFSELMDTSTITSNTFTLTDNSSNSITGTVTNSDSSSATTSTFTPSSTLSRSVQYTVTLSTGVMDLNGNDLSSAKTFSFTQPWTQQLGSSSNDQTGGLAIDSSGNLFVVGHTNGGLDGNSNSGSYDLFLVKYNSSGTKQWTKQLGTSSIEIGYDVSVDSSDNLYVSGYTEGDLDGNTNAGDAGDDSYGRDAFLVKYNNSGTKQWTKQIGTNYDEFAQGGTVFDSSGNIYLAGSTTGDLDGNTNAGTYSSHCSKCQDIFLIKYNSSGTRQWTKQIGSTSIDQPSGGVVIDSNNNIYIAGESWGDFDGKSNAGSTWSDIILVKYYDNGTKQWSNQIGTSSMDTCAGLAIDSNDNVYITGYTQGDLDGETNSYNSDMYLIKYNSSGTKQWTKLLGAGSSGDEEGKAITTDSSNNIFITGTTTGTFSDNTNYGSIDMFLVKYNDSGTKQWTKQFGTSSADYAKGIVIDSAGNTFVGGYTSGSFDGNTHAGNIDLFLLKFDSSGTKQ